MHGDAFSVQSVALTETISHASETFSILDENLTPSFDFTECILFPTMSLLIPLLPPVPQAHQLA